MDLGKLSYYSRKIHRISLWFVSVSGLTQMATGLPQRYPQMFSFVDMSVVITIHTTNSTIFSIFFSISMLTGLIMYIVPILLKKFSKPPKPTHLPN